MPEHFDESKPELMKIRLKHVVTADCTGTHLLFITASLELKARVASSLLAKVMRAEVGSPSNCTWTLTRLP